MDKIRIETVRKIDIDGVDVEIFKRVGGLGPDDYGYSTDIGIRGIGQCSILEAECDARMAIERQGR